MRPQEILYNRRTGISPVYVNVGARFIEPAKDGLDKSDHYRDTLKKN